MRISDSMLSSSYLQNINRSRERIESLQRKIATGNRIEKPSDSPVGASRIMRLSNQISRSDTYLNNIANSLDFLNDTTISLESLQNETLGISEKLVQVTNDSNAGNFDSFADQIDLTLKNMLNLANTESQGKFIFGGTDFSAQPFGTTSDGLSIEVKAKDLSGENFVKTAPNITQKININGAEIFSTAVKQLGNLDVNAAVGDVVSASSQIYNAEGSQFNLNTTYTKTAANTYSLSYDIIDGGGASVFAAAPAVKTLVFNSANGSLESVNGQTDFTFNIKSSGNKIDFNFELTSLSQQNAVSAVSFSANQKMDIFNTLIAIRDNLRNGIKPTIDQTDAVRDFNSRLLDKITEAGNIIRQMTDLEEMHKNQKLYSEELIAKEKEVDIPQAIIDLQNEDYHLQMAYKVSAMILPKSLLNYL